MTIDNIDIEVTLQKVEKLLSEEKGLSPAMRSMVELLVLLITLLVGRLNRTVATAVSRPQGIRTAGEKARRRVRGRQEDKRAVRG
ncbi:MAG: hypothetical protein JETT_2555 [Candidatus Jettenia ecosi]|uniref:Uncharacterized protein n=1 Tax=Candidatus Jettenia ecosi TaxID=2494326 RepID=A0A533Q912_9BACT|nr:MAG: hypothetical protein JETT_2555 [Candidatus Jettenia ecosi]